MTNEQTTNETTDELERIVARLAEGDPAATFTLAGRYGRAIEGELVRGGAPVDQAARLVHEVVLAALELAPTVDLAGWDLVELAVALVLADHSAPDPDGSGTVDLRAGAHPAGERSLHLVDVDNLVGGPRRAGEWFTTSLHAYRAVAGVAVDDQIVLSADASAYRETAFSVTGGTYKPGRGRDGADLVLLAAAPADVVAERYDRLVIGSGDHGFAPLAAEVAGRGVDVTVVARPRQLSRELRLAATDVRYLPDLPKASEFRTAA